MTIVHFQPCAKIRCALLLAALTLAAGCATTPSTTPQEPPPTSAQAGDTTVVAVSPACCPKQTLPQFLGITGLCRAARGLGSCILNRLGARFPGLEAKPPLTAISDPANLESDNPAVKAAAEVKTEEDQAEQKAKAIRYLATIGCGGCYPDVEAALLAALDDCTELVRYEAAKAFYEKSGCPCKVCSGDSCCSEEVLKRLNQVAYETDDEGCYLETSDRVRRMARMALRGCGGAPLHTPVPLEGPQSAQSSDELADEEPVEPGGMAQLEPEGNSSSLERLKEEEVITASTDSNAESVVLARVNGKPIYDFQIAPAVKARYVEHSVNSHDSDPISDRRKVIQQALDEFIVNELLTRAVKEQLSSGDVALTLFFEDVAPLFDEDRALGLREIKNVNTVANEIIDANIRENIEVSDQEISSYYAAHQEQYMQEPRIRFEQMTIKPIPSYSKAKAKPLAVAVLKRMTGRGKKLPENLKQLGTVELKTFDWMHPQDLESESQAALLLKIPVGETSELLENDEEFLFVRVLERQTAKPKVLHEVQEEIRGELLSLKVDEARQRYITQLRSQAEIWTIFDSIPNAVSSEESKSSSAMTHDASDQAGRIHGGTFEIGVRGNHGF